MPEMVGSLLAQKHLTNDAGLRGAAGRFYRIDAHHAQAAVTAYQGLAPAERAQVDAALEAAGAHGGPGMAMLMAAEAEGLSSSSPAVRAASLERLQQAGTELASMADPVEGVQIFKDGVLGLRGPVTVEVPGAIGGLPPSPQKRDARPTQRANRQPPLPRLFATRICRG